MNHPYLSVVVPMYNEEENVPLLIEAVAHALRDFDYELILVDDFSTDKTRANIKKYALDSTRLIELKKNYGQSSALMAGIDYATGEYIITMDGDLQNDPTDIPMMLSVLQEGDYDLVVGNRAKRKDGFFRVIISKIANKIIKWTTGYDAKDYGCALKVFTNETAKDLDLYGEFHRFITLIAHINGARIKQVDVQHHPRKHGESKYGFERTFKVLNDLALLLFQRKFIQKPLYLFGNAGMLFLFIGSLVNIYLLVQKFMYDQDIGTRPLLTVGVILLVVGIQFFTIGIVLDLLMRTYYESQHKRPFNIRKVINFQADKVEN